VASFNFMSPVMKCRLESKSGKVLDFKNWSNKYNVGTSSVDVRRAGGGTPVQGSNYPYVTALTVTTTGEGTDAGRGAIMANTIGIQIEAPYEQWLALVEDHLDVFVESTVARVQLGYSGRETGFLSEEFAANLQVINVDMSMDFVSMTLQAIGNTWYMSRREGKINTNGRTILQILREIADSHAAKLFYLDDRGELQPMPATQPTVVRQLGRSLTEVLEGSDYDIVKQLVHDHANLHFYMIGSRIVIYSAKAAGAQKFVSAFEFRGQVNLSEGVYPCLNFQNTNSQSTIRRAAAKIESQNLNLDTKQRQTFEALKKDLNVAFHRPFGVADDIPPGAASSADAIAGGSSQEIPASSKPYRKDQRGIYMPLASNDPSAKEKVVSVKQQAEGLSGVISTWETLGNPLIRPGQEADVRGVSSLFSGRYHLSKVTHVGNLSGYTTQIEGKTYGRSKELAPGTVDTRGQAPQAETATARAVDAAIDTQVKKVSS